MADSSDFMLNEEDDFKSGQSGFEEVDGTDIFADVSKKDEEPESAAFDDIDGADIFGDGDAADAVEEKIEEAPVAAAAEAEPQVVEEPVKEEPEIIEEPLKVEPLKEEPAPVEEIKLDDDIETAPPVATPRAAAPVVEEVIPVAESEVAAPNAFQEDVVPVSIKAKVEVEPVKTFDIVIKVSDPHKVGDGMMSSYMAYKVTTKTSMSQFKNADSEVDRRFSDFLGLHEKLLAKHRHVGHIVPPAPEKSLVGMTLVKISKSEEEAASIDFVEKRRAALERYMNRLVRHAPIVHDQDLVAFLEVAGTLPQATNTRALSSGGMMRFVKNVEGAFNKMTIKMVEEDSWFEEKQQQIGGLELQLKKLHHGFESLVQHRKNLAVHNANFAKSCASLGNSEEHTSLSRALAQLSDSFEKLEGQHQEQANSDFFNASEIVGDYLKIINEVNEVFQVRVKSWQTWQQAEQAVVRKREQEMKAQAAGRQDKLQVIKAELLELQERVKTAKEDFEKLSEQIKKQIGRFEKDRVADLKKMVLQFLKNMMKSQENTMRTWEAFLPEARAIA